MKCVFLFLLGLLMGFFDFFYFFMFFSLFLVFLLLDLGGGWFGGIFFADNLSFFLIYLTSLILFFCVFSNLSDLWHKNSFFGYLFVLASIFFLLLLSFISFSVFFFYICFESIFMLMFLFVMTWGYSPERVQASFYMVFYTILVSFPFLVYLVTFESSSFSFKFCLNYSPPSYWWFFLLLVFMVKLPVYGVHLWLPKAHVEAPVSGSMVLAGVLLKLGGYGFMRFTSVLHLSLHKHSGYLLSMGLIGGLISCSLCLRQSDMKSYVAYSSICHMGFGLAGLYSYSSYGFLGGLYMMIGHGFCSSCLFYILYIVYKRFHSRSLFIIKGLNYVLPSLVMSWFIFCIINMGVPPSFAFFSELGILVGISSLSLISCLASGLFLFMAGVYGIFLFTLSSHGHSLLEGYLFSISVREYLTIYAHLFPLVFVSFFLNFFFV